MTVPHAEEIAVRLRFANVLKKAELYQDAVEELQAVLAMAPDCAPAYNNLGAICFICQDYVSAVHAYLTALDIRPDYLDVYYNLGLAYSRNRQLDEAITAYRALIALAPDHAGAHFQLGCLLMQRQQFQNAAQAFSAVIASHPHHFETLANLAACYLQLGQMVEATTCYLRALEINAEDKDVLFNLGVIHIQQGYTQEGVQYYLRAIKAHPDFFAAHHNLAAIYLMRRDHENALRHYRESLRIHPDDEALRHTVKILLQDKTLTTSSPAYIESLFDSYAGYYDAHLRTHLQYQVPEKLHALLSGSGILPVDAVILDLGCGTGLCGILLRPHARRLIGVDLSTRMLEVAAQKQLYDELVPAEVVAYLSTQSAVFDLIVAGDVLVYFGDLQPLLAAAQLAVKPGGYLAFNVESAIENDYSLTASGRFVHQKEYLTRVARNHGFEIIAMQPDVLRSQAETPVPGYLCLWQRQDSGAA